MYTDSSYFECIPKYKDFTFWFVPIDGEYYYVVDKTTGKFICKTHETSEFELDYFNNTNEIIDKDWTNYKSRPEYYLYHRSENFCVDFADLYDLLLTGSVMAMAQRKGEDPDTQIPRIVRGLKWLHSTDFYTAPSSTKYHDSCSGGLLSHTLNVVSRAVDLLKADTFSTVHFEDAVFASLVHDWCKIGLYEEYKRNVKDDKTGEWNQEISYRHKDDRTACLGHGTTSMYVASKFFTFSMEVAAAIRWHMSVWNCCESEKVELGQANRQYPLVHLIQFADQLSIVNY